MSMQHVDQLAVERGYCYAGGKLAETYYAALILQYRDWLRGERRTEPKGLTEHDKQLIREALERPT